MSSTFSDESTLHRFEPATTPTEPPDATHAQVWRENQALKEQIAAQTQLMHLLTHQLATPLTSLNGSVHLLGEPWLEPDQRQEFLDLVQQQVQRLQTLLKDLITFRNLETSTFELHPVRFELPKLVAEVADSFSNPTISYHFSPDLSLVWGDRWQISQVLVNLFSNALKYSPSDSPIEVGASLLASGWVEIWVQDHGLGIPAADQPHVFEQFYRVQHCDRQNISGTGLGLSLCKLLVENQGGQMGFESTHGQGSRFYFTLPTQEWQGEIKPKLS